MQISLSNLNHDNLIPKLLKNKTLDKKRDTPSMFKEERSDLIKKFYNLFLKSKAWLQSKVKEFHEIDTEDELSSIIIIQLMIIWFLQEKGFFDDNPNYLIIKFQSYVNLGFGNYSEFLDYLFSQMIQETTCGSYRETDIIGRIVVTGAAPFIDAHCKLADLKIPDEVFYITGLTETIKTSKSKKMEKVPILNLFESCDWTEGNIDEYVLGSIYEKIITDMERKKKGAYYTPEAISQYICRTSLDNYILERLNTQRSTHFNTKDEIFQKQENYESVNDLIYLLREIKICDPAVGSAHFLESMINALCGYYESIYHFAKKYHISTKLDIITTNLEGVRNKINVLTIENPENFRLVIKYFIISSQNIYGVDINPTAIKIARTRLFLTIAKHFTTNNANLIRFPDLHFNLRQGDSLLFQWISEFPEVFLHKGGFDIVIGNPPYVGIKGQFDIFSRYKSSYKSIAIGKTDLYILFFEKGLALLNSNGWLGYISPNAYLKTEDAKPLRNFLVNNSNVYEIIDFSANQVFKGVSTYTAITILQKNTEFQMDTTYKRWYRSTDKNLALLENSEKPYMTKLLKKEDMKNEWWFEEYPIISKISKISKPLKSSFIPKDGLVTSKDRYFIGRIDETDSNFVPFQRGRTISSKVNKKFVIERKILQPLLYGEHVKRYQKNKPKYYIIFPHFIKKSRDTTTYGIIDVEEMQKKYPKTWKYFTTFETEFGSRTYDSKKKKILS